MQSENVYDTYIRPYPSPAILLKCIIKYNKGPEVKNLASKSLFIDSHKYKHGVINSVSSVL